MDVKEAIKIRRSIRKYKNTEVSGDLINEIIDAARLAPSGHNAQPAIYFIVRDVRTKQALKDAKVFKQNFVCESPAIIVCCGNPDVYGKTEDPDGSDDSLESRTFRDVAIASSYLVLRATELGLGTCYIGWRHKENIKKVLNIPKNFVVPFVITLGYPAESPSATLRKKIKDIMKIVQPIDTQRQID